MLKIYVKIYVKSNFLVLDLFCLIVLSQHSLWPGTFLLRPSGTSFVHVCHQNSPVKGSTRYDDGAAQEFVWRHESPKYIYDVINLSIRRSLLVDRNTFCTSITPRLFIMDLSIVEYKVFFTVVSRTFSSYHFFKDLLIFFHRNSLHFNLKFFLICKRINNFEWMDV